MAVFPTCIGTMEGKSLQQVEQKINKVSRDQLHMRMKGAADEMSSRSPPGQEHNASLARHRLSTTPLCPHI
jgi:hypothetical protein